MYFIPIKFDDVEVDALFDTGACLSAILLNVFNKILGLASSNILFCKEKPVFKIQAANGETCPVLFSAIISFQINGFTENYHFQEEFLILKEMNTPLLGLPFFKYNGINILTSTGMLQLPDLTVHLNSMLKPLQRTNPPKSKSTNKNINLFVKNDVTLKPFTMEIIECEAGEDWKLKEITGVVEPTKRVETNLNLCLTNAICTLEGGVVKIGIMNLNEHDFKVPKGLSIARLTVLTLEQTKYLAPIDVILCNFLERQHPGERENFLNQLTQGLPEEYPQQKFWFPTPEDKPDLTKLNAIERRLHDEILKFKEAESLDPQTSTEEKQKFLGNFIWDGSI